MYIFGARFCRKKRTSIIQPLDQGIILATKRLYRKKVFGGEDGCVGG
jgi:hypothetical protein